MKQHNPEKLSVTDDLTHLGSQKTEYVYSGADKTLLEWFPNPMPVGSPFTNTIEIKAPEFTSLCPLTGQPDFATIVVNYIPNERCVESKAFKLYLGSFRNVGEFHEACVTRIALDLVELLNPLYLVVEGQFTPRGGIPFWPRIEYTHPDPFN
jgi:7-cyano-7-deazaguanine reductase